MLYACVSSLRIFLVMYDRSGCQQHFFVIGYSTAGTCILPQRGYSAAFGPSGLFAIPFPANCGFVPLWRLRRHHVRRQCRPQDRQCLHLPYLPGGRQHPRSPRQKRAGAPRPRSRFEVSLPPSRLAGLSQQRLVQLAAGDDPHRGPLIIVYIIHGQCCTTLYSVMLFAVGWQTDSLISDFSIRICVLYSGWSKLFVLFVSRLVMYFPTCMEYVFVCLSSQAVHRFLVLAVVSDGFAYAI